MQYGIEDIPVAAAFFRGSEKGDLYLAGCNGRYRAITSRTEKTERKAFEDGLASYAEGSDDRPGEFIFPNCGRNLHAYVKKTQGGYLVCCTDGHNAKAGPMEYRIRVMELILKSLSEGIVAADGAGRIVFINKWAQRLTGWGRDAVGAQAGEVLPLYFGTGGSPIPSLFELAENSGCGRESTGGYILKRKDGRPINVYIRISRLFDDSDAGGFVAVFHDTEQEKKRENEILYLSYHDKLTDLYNRPYFEKKLRELDKRENCPISLIVGDANGLKVTNDLLGRKYGDRMLLSISNILCLACREDDIVSRYGGGEFAVLMPQTDEQEAATVIKKITALCENEFIGKNKISMSLGYATKRKFTENMSDIMSSAETAMYRNKLLESKSTRNSAIASLKKTLYEKSYETEEHAMRLTGLCNEAGRRLGLSEKDLSDLELLAMLHDIGKVGISDSILCKPGKLSDMEWTEMRKHCEIGYRIAESTPELSHVAKYILSHHERWDGKGYPQGLAGEKIPLPVRILSVADSYDAMVNDRSYRKAMTNEEAVKELERNAGTQFDPAVVSVFLDIIGQRLRK